MQDQSKKVIGWILLGIAAIIFIIIMGQMYTIFGEFGNGLGLDSPEIMGWIIMLGLLITVIIVVAIGSSKGESKYKGIFVPAYEK